MKYYIIKPRNTYNNIAIIDGICLMDEDAQIVDKLEKCDIAVLQKGWTGSSVAVAEMEKAKQLKKTIKEGYVYREKYCVHLNCEKGA